jgi:hypothetical protein
VRTDDGRYPPTLLRSSAEYRGERVVGRQIGPAFQRRRRLKLDLEPPELLEHATAALDAPSPERARMDLRGPVPWWVLGHVRAPAVVVHRLSI